MERVACSREGRASPFPQQTEQQRQQNAEEQARGQWEIQLEVFAFDADVAGQPAEPRQFAAEPEQCPEHYQYKPDEDQHFANVIHENRCGDALSS
jgi:hypothetical protein